MTWYCGSLVIGSLDVPLVVRFDFTGAAQTFVVPVGYTTADFELTSPGAQVSNHGIGSSTSAFGLPVAPGDTFAILCGGLPATDFSGLGGFNGGGNVDTSVLPSDGGGFGATDVRFGGSTLADRILVAGGPAGIGSNSRAAGSNTLSTPGAGGDPNGYDGDDIADGAAGKGASTSAGGAAGAGVGFTAGTAGALGVGGDGAYAPGVFPAGAGFGAGGGGGFYGGGGGAAMSGELQVGGGGGSSYVDPGLTLTSSSFALVGGTTTGIVIVTLHP